MLRTLVVAACCLSPVVLYAAKNPPPAAQQPQGPQISAALAKPLRAAQEALQKEDFTEALKQLDEAQAIPARTPADDYQINEFLGYIYIKKADYPAAAKAFEASLATGQLPPDKVDERVRILAQLYFQAKNYPKAVEFGTRWRDKAGNADPEVNVLVGQSQYLSNDFRNAAASMQTAIDAATKAGKPVNETWMQVQLSSYVQLKDQAGTIAALQKLVASFPKKAYWEDLFNLMQRQQGIDERTQLNVLRLAYESGLIKNADDYFQMAQIASRLGVPGEAVKSLEQGNARKVFTSEIDVEKCRQMLQTARSAAAADRKALVALEKEAAASSAGEADVQLGIAFISYDQFDKGIEAIKRGLSKGKLKRPDEAQIMLGKALLKLNRADEAKAAFQKVERSSKLSTIADLWVIYSQQSTSLAS